MLRSHRGRFPEVAESSFVEQSAMVIGDVVIGADSSIWFNVVIRGDVNSIRIGSRTNIQDGSVVHVTRDTHPTVIGDEVTIGHNVTLHGCTVNDRCLIGMAACVLDGAVIGEDSMVAAGALVPPGRSFPPGSLIMGAPAAVKRPLTDSEIRHLKRSAANYVGYMQDYLPGNDRAQEQE
ncbi:gamma carbonic anhydrase family protein [Desulfuromonas versatilis]|uniref:Gamma carbonic anhydrase family protein n=1 Tax=Desulfuromonas versatilis TaxID=2802975 RepID=A0ABN6DZR4_9BACT|nr:gamma carbonic anhydrase family protein [Desulfuromonas versatilis]BCR05019.1 gamma carbonic anhydrase family protein [Desulfuromonas versatilis]